MEVKFKYTNGDKVQDIISGLEGIIECSALWINGCKRYSVQPRAQDKATVKPEAWWVDEEQLLKISDGVRGKVTPSDTGGPSMRSASARK